MSLNNFLPFCPTDTGTNLETQAAYAADTSRTAGNQPGVASAKLNNKALRQGTYITSQIAQLASDYTGTDVLDDAIPAKLLSQLRATISPLAPALTSYLSGSGTHNVTYNFYIATGNATVGATYTNNAITYTVKATIASGLTLLATGAGAPLTSGTLTKTGGTGDSTITFYAVRAPLYVRVRMVGGGGGGAGSGSTGSAGAGGNAGNTTFGTTLLVANGATGGAPAGSAGAGAGGSASLGTGPSGVALTGGTGGGFSQGSTTASIEGPSGATSPFGGAGGGGFAGGPGGNAIANSGSGGGGGGGSVAAANFSGQSGGAGGFVDAIINSPLSTYAYAVGSGGSAGTAGTSGFIGGTGGSGAIYVEERYQ